MGNSPSRPDTAGAQAYSAEAQNQVGHIREPQRAPKLEGPGTSEGGVQGWGRESLVRSSQIPCSVVIAPPSHLWKTHGLFSSLSLDEIKVEGL